jgi:transcriptional regulator with PAS, ATPase and Fis domain
MLAGERMIGESQQTMDLRDCIQRISASDTNVLITGETGTGKELVAELIQANSRRHSKPFIRINCAAIPDTLLESELFGYERGAFTGAHSMHAGQMELADGGTIFFDEIGDMSPYAQAKILRAIEGKEVQRLGGNKRMRVDVRIIAATNRDLDTAETFRRDLYYRVNVARVHLAPLRDRKADIPPLIRHQIGALNRQFGRQVEGLEASALATLLAYGWPGNIRELKNLLESLFVHLPSGPVRWVSIPQTVLQKLIAIGGLPPSEQELLLEALWSTNWNKSKAAKRLQWSRMTLYRKMAKYHLASRAEVTGGAGA